MAMKVSPTSSRTASSGDEENILTPPETENETRHGYPSEAYSLIKSQCLPRDYSMKAEIYAYACRVAQLYQCCQLHLGNRV
jgi:hypothetical protein